MRTHPTRSLAVLTATVAGSAGVAVGLAGSPPTAVAATASPCAGVAGCRVVATSDLDGDGRGDRIGVVEPGDNRSRTGRVRVLVRTASGRSLSTSHRVKGWAGGSSFRGTAKVGPDRGRELVMGTATLADASKNRFVTVLDGKLVTMPAPNGASVWTLRDGTGGASGYARRVDAAGTVRVEARATERRSDGRWRVIRTYHELAGNEWHPAGWTSDVVATAPARVAGLSGFGVTLPY